jgi:hypothetical protein
VRIHEARKQLKLALESRKLAKKLVRDTEGAPQQGTLELALALAGVI